MSARVGGVAATTKTTNKQTIYFYTNWIQLILDNITEQTNN